MPFTTPSSPKRFGDNPARLRFHSGHTWVRAIGREMAFVGTTEFALAFAGALETILLPREQLLVRPGTLLWSLVSREGRRLGQVSPLGGRVLVVNTGVLKDLDRLQRSPYGSGWLVCIQSPTLPQFCQNLPPLEPDLLGLERMTRAMTQVLGPAADSIRVQDRWKARFGDDLADDQWESLRSKLFPEFRTAESRSDPTT